jgi:ArsR family transcriptional regulator, nickel/cobalt-responsive transcriptional repressor
MFMYARDVGHGVQGHSHAGRLDAATAADVAETMQALAAPSRVRILAELSERPRSVGELAAAVEMEQSAVSHQLRLLRHLGLVVGERQGRRIVYALHDSHVAVLLAEATYHVEHLRLGLIDRAAKAS